MPAPLLDPTSIPANYQRAVDVTIGLIADKGIKGTSLREIGLAANVNFGNLTSFFGGKDRLVAQCFRQAAETNLERARAFYGEAAGLSLSAEHGATILWDCCRIAAEGHRAETLVLAELVMAAEGNPLFEPILAQWFVERTRIIRAWGQPAGLSPAACDALNLITIAEACFYLSCGHSLLYRLVAHGALAELLDLCTGTRPAAASDSLPELAATFFARDQLPQSDAGKDAVGAKARAQIVEAAANIVAEHGLDGVSTRLVAQKADISLGLISYHFPSITNLALAGLSRLLERVIEEMDDPQTRNPVLERVLGDRRGHASLPRASILAYRSMLQLSLTAGRMPAQAMAGQILRRRMGTVIIRAMDFSPTSQKSRTRASSFALATAALFTILPALPEDALDLQELLRFLTYDMLGFEPDL